MEITREEIKTLLAFIERSSYLACYVEELLPNYLANRIDEAVEKHECKYSLDEDKIQAILNKLIKEADNG